MRGSAMATSRWAPHPRARMSRVPVSRQISRSSPCASRPLGVHPRWVPSHEPARGRGRTTRMCPLSMS
eukprot:2687098-Heterocapsa_arctica.AAC.1